MSPLPPETDARRLMRARRARRQRGLCADFGCKEKSGADYRCPTHTARYNLYVQRHRVRKRQMAALEKR